MKIEVHIRKELDDTLLLIGHLVAEQVTEVHLAEKRGYARGLMYALNLPPYDKE